MTTDESESLSRRLAVSVLTLVVAAGVLYGLLTKPWVAEGTRLTADFDGASQGLTTSSPIKVRGVQVGQVEAIDLLSNGRARLTLRVNEGVQVPRTARASLEPESVFGPKFINLIPGAGETAGPYFPDRAHIAATSGSEDLDNMLSSADRMLKAIDPRDVAIIVGTLAQGLGGQGPQLRELLDDADTIVAVGHRNRQRAVRFTADLAQLAQVRGIGDSVAGLAGDTNAIVGTAASGQDRLRRLTGETARLSGTLAGGLDRHGGQLGTGARSAERAAAFIYAQLGVGGGIVGPSVNSIIDQLPIYRAATWPVAPQGRHMLAAKIMLPTDPCELILGICGDNTPTPTGTGSATGTAPAPRQSLPLPSLGGR
jgi:phospholipid/cholesterol/gamma-HCH transport system substrate-binding protein